MENDRTSRLLLDNQAFCRRKMDEGRWRCLRLRKALLIQPPLQALAATVKAAETIHIGTRLMQKKRQPMIGLQRCKVQ